MTSSQTISATLLPRLIEVSVILVIILCTRPYNLAVLQPTVHQAAFRLSCLTCLSAGSLCFLSTRAHIIVFQDLARSLLPLASTTTTHHDIELKYPRITPKMCIKRLYHCCLATRPLCVSRLR
ncbi:hypothetical protein DFH08DRAFT_1089157 [Mycena albidolilacea]|uniref:Uncharacterized protein n=1 Tax=Mycena albidolilacea TaxID=1033008 RepID=A0AAD6Z2T5_9AGAR|nr:hypothetical protein DFH08DRAFT_1089157 [Mycena albidolilacea]